MCVSTSVQLGLFEVPFIYVSYLRKKRTIGWQIIILEKSPFIMIVNFVPLSQSLKNIVLFN